MREAPDAGRVRDIGEQLNTPVLFLVFNRPETVRQVFKAIRQAQPAAFTSPQMDRMMIAQANASAVIGYVRLQRPLIGRAR